VSKRPTSKRFPLNRKLRVRRAVKSKLAAKRRSVPPRRRRRRTWWLILAGALVGFVIAAGIFYYRFLQRRGPATEHVAVSWPPSLDASDAASLLADLELTDSPATMEVFLRATEAESCFVPGPHLLPAGATPRELRAALCREPDRPRAKLTIPEGFHRFAIADRVHKKGIASREAFLHASANRELLQPLGIEPGAVPEADTAEGYLFPATYDVPIDTDPNEVVRMLVDEANRRWNKLRELHVEGWKTLQEEFDWGRREVLTLASMVEKEAVVSEERAVIASVFINRLRDPAFPKLQSDPTAMYGCFLMPERIPSCDGFNGRASGALNRDAANGYSTYVIDGLPPGPIANPGEASIAAVLSPADTDYRFFVASGEGRHQFSVDYADHEKAIERLRELRAR